MFTILLGLLMIFLQALPISPQKSLWRSNGQNFERYSFEKLAVRVLQAQDGTLKWVVECRVIYAHTPTPIRFPNETEQVVHLSFKGPDQMKTALKQTRDKEANWIFQYRLTPIGHKEKPKVGTNLQVHGVEEGPSNES